MKIIAKYTQTPFIPLLTLFIHDAPHRRMHIKIIQQYRLHLQEALLKIGVKTPIEEPIDLWILFINPSSIDLGNLYLALEQALDDKTLTKPGVVLDDSLIQSVQMAKYFNARKKK